MSPLASLWVNWGFTATWPLAGKAAVTFLPVTLFIWMGSLLGALYFAPGIMRGKMRFAALNRKLVWELLVIGFFGSAMPSFLYVAALEYTTPANAAILAQIEVVYSIAMSVLILKEKISLSQLAGTTLVVAGTLLIAFKERYSPRWTGDLIILATPWMYQLSHVYVKKLPKDFSPEFIAFTRAAAAFLTFAPIALFFLFAGAAKPVFCGFKPVLALLFWGLVLNGFNNVLWYRAIRNMDLSKATAIILSYPVMTVILSVAFGVEKVKPYQLIGLVCAMTGAYWVTCLVRNSAAVGEI